MNSSTHFFILYVIVCFSIILLFYFLFKRSEVPRTGILTKKIPSPITFLRQKINKEIPGIEKSDRGKPLSMPYDPLRKKMNTKVEKSTSTPYDFVRQKMNKGVPGMDSSERGKPLPAP
jgi:hypothetical protein